MTSWRERVGKILAATAAKVSIQEKGDEERSKSSYLEEEEGPLVDEYNILERIGPVPHDPGNAWLQHEEMLRLGLCKAAAANLKHNRYSNLFPYDTSRIVVDNPENDYLNASLIKVAGVDTPLILAMGPMHPDYHGEDTTGQFWRAVHQQKVGVIVMLCGVQAGYSGCAKYFPRPGEVPLKSGGVRVEAVEDKRGESTIITILKVNGADITHIQFTKWPNYGVVENVEELGLLVKTVAQEQTSREFENAPILIHCSGGVGRSGTFATLYSLYHLLQQAEEKGWKEVEKYLKEGDEVSLVPLVTMLRETRHPWMVEGLHQYKLAYATLLWLLEDLLKHNQK